MGSDQGVEETFARLWDLLNSEARDQVFETWWKFGSTVSRLREAKPIGKDTINYYRMTDAQLERAELLIRAGVGGPNPVGLNEIAREKARRAGGNWRTYAEWRLA